MAHHSIPQVIIDHLIPSDRANQSFLTIQVGSEAWYAWLNEPAIRSFAFHSPRSTLTVRPEHRHLVLVSLPLPGRSPPQNPPRQVRGAYLGAAA